MDSRITPTRGRIIEVHDEWVLFAPANTRYHLKLNTAGKYDGPVNALIDGFVRADARKLWTMASGGNFITPIQGPPRIVQGRVRFLDQQMMAVQCGAVVIVKLPAADSALDLNNGQLEEGAMVNATLMPGAKLEWAAVAAGA